ncbi:unnamed protein product [Oikopleura dioica]|uniref:CCDC81 HU domain-containing protein n=1 Tax=Oikopleura dioica TaxID=34765 RepID=E4YQ40_OIKDI|nr:unnamed protein product [Oikopleura dioica]
MEHLQAARNDKHSSVKNILVDDVERIWAAFCNYIINQLTEQVGVKIKNLGVITVKSLNLDVGRRNLSITKPSFILDEKQSQHYGIKYGRPFTSYQKNKPVNYAEIATVSNTTRDIAELVINELIMAFWKKFAEKQRANFTISDVLTIHLKEDVVRAVFAGKIVELFEFAPTKKTVNFRREYTLPVVSQSTEAAFQPEMPKKSKSDLDENWKKVANYALFEDERALVNAFQFCK